MDFKCDTTLLRDELSDTKLHRYLTDMAQSSSKRFKKIKDRGGPTYTILPPLNYQEDTTLPNNTAMVDRRKLVKLEEKAAKLDQAVADNQRMVAELEELQTQVKALSSELSAKAAACSDEDPVTGDAVHKYSDAYKVAMAQAAALAPGLGTRRLAQLHILLVYATNRELEERKLCGTSLRDVAKLVPSSKGDEAHARGASRLAPVRAALR